MAKMKTHSGAKKRFKVNKNGKVKYTQSGRRHILTKKSPKRMMKLRGQGSFLSSDKQSATIATMVTGR